MTRSMSGCDHFLRRTRDLFTSISSLNRKKASGLERSSEPVSTEAHFNTPAISIKLLPTVSLASDLNCTRDNFPTIAQLDQGETHSHSDSMGSPLPERLRGDGGSITGPEQSEGIWEWDDYKVGVYNLRARSKVVKVGGQPNKQSDPTDHHIFSSLHLIRLNHLCHT